MTINQLKNPKKPKNTGGRPSSYTKEQGDLLCEIVATTSKGLSKICDCINFPHESTVRRWRLEHEEFSAQYARAKILQADILAEECLEIADNSISENVMVDRLRIDTRKWLASKLLPKQYGDKLLLEQKTEENEQLKEELRNLREKLDGQNKREF